mmetsp:Transcript_26637/g.67733  ORF Transcript_26637/g.67733 Transcript_26637/m.67733 type:complete len:314 (+) Transcript_26637:50-991(+)
MRSGQARSLEAGEAHAQVGLPGLFCFVVIAAEFGHVPSTVNILNAGLDAGFSGCSTWRIYSNVSEIDMISSHSRCENCVEMAIMGSMDVPRGKPAGAYWQPTALNTPIFQQVWKHVFDTGIYNDWAWTIKTEVDTVFAASHLQLYLYAMGLASEPAFMLNVVSDLHGPIEAITQLGVAQFALAPPDTCDGVAQNNPSAGEDWWLSDCLKAVNVTGVKADFLLNDGGSHYEGADDTHFAACDTGYVSNHPRASPAIWNKCFTELIACNAVVCDASSGEDTGSGAAACADQPNATTQPLQLYGHWCCCTHALWQV